MFSVGRRYHGRCLFAVSTEACIKRPSQDPIATIIEATKARMLTAVASCAALFPGLHSFVATTNGQHTGHFFDRGQASPASHGPNKQSCARPGPQPCRDAMCEIAEAEL